ncbi:hypothetical protein BB559_001601 [Furculomyces boomerangus]|uniref:Uncharacterized protein n=1 Tax=Furculomyces boomerangus TaxID=61424 RepID=A0A2T9Z1C7_9FUNG|nr:hypothetical protein BB559_001601 [Furculomyces boomerangus]
MSYTTINQHTNDTQLENANEGFQILFNTERKEKSKETFQSLNNNQEPEELVQFREILFNQNWLKIEKIVDFHIQENHLITAKQVVRFVNSGAKRNSVELKTKLPRTEIKTGVIFTGANSSEHSQGFETLESLLKNSSRSDHFNIVTRLDSQKCSSLKAIISQFITQIINNNQHVDNIYSSNDKNKQINFEWGDEDNSGAYEIETRNILEYDMNTFETYYQSRFKNVEEKPQVITILENFEGFPGAVISDFIMILSRYINSFNIPIVLVLGIATTLSTLHQSLTKSAIQRLSIAKFSLGSEQELVNKLVLDLFVKNNSNLNMGFDSYKYLMKQFTHSNLSIFKFKQNLKYALMDFFYGSPLSILSCCLKGDPNYSEQEMYALPKDLNLTTDHVEMIMMQPSVMRFLDNMYRNNINGLKEAIKTPNFFIHNTLPKIIFCFQFFQKRYSMGVQIVENIQESISKVNSQFTKYPIRALHYNALENDFETSSPWKNIISHLRFMKGEDMKKLLQTTLKIANDCESEYQNYLSTYPEQPDFTGIEYTRTLTGGIEERFEDCISMFSDNFNFKNKNDGTVYTRKQINENPYLLVSTSGEVGHEAALIKSNKLIPAIINGLLAHYSVFPLNEVFYYRKHSFLAQSFNPQPRTSIQTALAKPSFYLGQCDCCSTKVGESTWHSNKNTDPLLATNNDVSIVYRLYLECGENPEEVNEGDPPEKSKTKKQKPKADVIDVNVLNRFILAVNTLYYIGFIKKTNRKTDHVARLAWGYV